MNKTAGRLGSFLAALLFSAAASATPEILDWDTLTWVPEGNTNLSETYTIGSGDITVTFGGNTADLDQAGAVISPAINAQNTGGLVPAENGLYVATDYTDASNPMVTVTFDFTGYPGGVGNLSFNVFDMDLGSTFIDEMSVTALTPSGPINPTSIVTSVANTQTNANTVRGTAGAGGTTSDGNATFVFGDGGTPVSGITQVSIVWRNQIGTSNPGFQWINIHDFDFDDPMADTQLTKSVAPATAEAGDTVVFTLDVVNNGPDDAPGVAVTDLLPAGFTYLTDNGGGSYASGSGVWTVGTLAPSGTAQLTIDARMEATGPWDNSAEVTALLATDPDSTPNNNVPAEDDQDNAAVTLAVPELGVAKRVVATPVNNGDGSYTLTYEVTVENSGDVTLNGIQVVDDLAATFVGTTGVTVDSVTSTDFTVNAGYNGTTDTNVLAGTDSLLAAASGIVSFTVTVDAGGNLGPFNNTATGSGTSPGGAGVNDASTSGTDPDPDGDGDPGNNSVPTPISFTEAPQIGVAKAVNAGPTNNGDGTFTLTYRFTLENFGDIPLNSVQLVDNLSNTFSGATGFTVDSVTSTDFTPNAGFNGTTDTNVLAGTDGLALAAVGTVDVTVTVTPGGNPGPYDNASFASAQSPGGSLTLDNSVDGLDPDPDGNGDPVDNVSPTPVTFSENPELGVAKRVVATPVNNGDGSYTLTYEVTVENSGDVTLNGIQVVDDLAATFVGTTGVTVDSVTSTDFTVNAGYNGTTDTNVLAGTDSLLAAASGIVSFTVTVDAGGNLGPFNNTATGSGTSPGGAGVNDASTSGTDPDPDGDGDPGNNSVPTPISFTEAPQIGVAKAVNAGPTNNGDGTFTLTYRFTLENFGDIPLNSVQLVDNLSNTFSGATGFTVDSVTSTDFTPNAGFNGTTDTNVLAGTDGLALAAVGTVDVTVTVTPGGNPGPYDNASFASAQSPGGSLTLDNSVDGLDPDPDGNGDPVDNVSPTPVSFAENPEIGTAKSISTGPTNNGDGTYTLTYTVTVENSGDVSLDSVQVVDDLASTFAGATGFTVDSVTSTDFTVNPGYNGSTDTNVLAGTDSLAVAAIGTIDITATLTPGSNLGPYDNTANGSGTSPGGTVVADDSNTGTNPDPDGDGDPTNNNVPTTLNLPETPEIGTAKSVSAGPTNNGDGTFTLTYTVTVNNSGDVPLSGVQVVDNLATTFSGATGFTVDSVTSTDFSVNPGYDGSTDTSVLSGTDSLATGTGGTVDITVTVTPGGNLGPYSNTATGSGTSPGGTNVSDDSTAGNNPDPDGDGDPGNNATPTPVSFSENPQIGVAKALTAGPVNNGDGTHTLTYRFTLENFGDVVLTSVQVVENLAGTFAAATGFTVDTLTSTDFTANGAFDGNADTNLLDGSDSLVLGGTGTIDLTITVTPGGNLGPYDNNVFAQAFSPGGTLTLDNSVDGLDPDPDGNGDPVDNVGPTPVSFMESPEIGLAKSASAPVSNGDGTYTFTYAMTVENSGDVPLDSLQVTTDLASAFAGATGFTVDSVTSADFAVNPGYNGSTDTNLLAATDTIAAAATGTIALTITVTPGGNLGPYDCIAIASGDSPAGTTVMDTSTDGANPDPDGDGNPANNSVPTPVSFAENPEVGIAKSAGAPVNNGDGTYTFTYTMTVENFGDVALDSLQVITDLGTAFAGATGFTVDSVTSTDFTVNAGYDGSTDTNLLAGSDTIAIGATGTIDLTLTVTPGGNLGPYDCIAIVSGTSPAGTGVNDTSTQGVDPDPDGDGDPGNNTSPTPVSFAENPQVGIAKTVSAGATNNGDGTYTLTYSMAVENFGDVDLNMLQVVTDLGTAFAGATGFVVDSVTSTDFAVNPGYDGSTDTSLLAGTDTFAVAATGSVDLTITVTPGGNLGPYDCTAIANGTSPIGTLSSDTSVDGTDPDPDADNDPTNNTSPTTVLFAENPQIGVAKAITAGPANNGDGSYTLTYTMTVENFGDTPLDSVQVVDNLANTFSAATGFSVDAVTSADFTVNPAYDGNADTNLLDGSDTLAVTTTGAIDLVVTVTPGANLGPYDNSVFAQGTSPGGALTLDSSVEGLDPDPDGNNDPVDNVGPTPVSFGEAPEIGLAKSASAPVNNGDGTFTFTYTMTVENSGDVALDMLQVVTDLGTAFAGATGFAIDSVTSTDFTVNAAYDGSGDTNLLAGSDTIGVGASGTIDVTLTVTPGGNLGPYDCIAVASGTSPAGTVVNDTSTVGANPDPDGDGDPGNNSEPTPVSFAENPQIGVAKAITGSPSNNGDGTFTFTYTMTVENFGDVTLNSVQVVENLAGTFAAATAFTVDALTSADFTVNPAFDGDTDRNLLDGSDTLAVAASGTIDLTVTVTPGSNLGPYDNSVFAQGFAPGGSLTLDNSVDGLDPDPDGNNDPVDNISPTSVTFGENPVIGIAKSVSAGPVNNGDGTFTFTYTMTVENYGDVALDNTQVTTDLAAAFAGASGFVVDSVTSTDFTVNAAYDGSGDTSLLAGTDTIAAGATGTIDVTLTVTPGANLGPYDCIAVASGTSPAGTNVNDTSTAGADPDPDGDGDPGNNSDPTPVSFAEMPQIGTAKAAGMPVNNGDGTFTLTYTIAVENSGDVGLDSVQVTDDLSTTFAGTTGFTVDSVTSSVFAVNPAYDGSSDINLLTGTDTLAVAATGNVAVTVTVTAGGNFGPFDNSATASGLTPSGTPVSDISTVGADPDPGNDGPGDDSTPTPVTFDPGVAAISGNAWLDQDIDDLFDGTEPPLDGWIIEIIQNGVVVATVPVAPDGSYFIDNLPPGGGYSVQLRHPSSSAVFGLLDNLTLPPGGTLTDQNLAIDPSGVVYDSVSRVPVPGVTVTLVDANGIPLPDICLLPDQQDQVTDVDGLYRFDLLVDIDPACPSGNTYDIVFTVPAGYVPGVSATIPPEAGALSATGQPDPFQVQPQFGAPTGGASTLYYLSFLLSAGDPNIINNHIPIDPVSATADVLVSKRADRRQTVVGDLIVYTVTVENPGAAITGLTLSDMIPAGFTYVQNSARLQPATGVTVTGQRPVAFGNISVPAGESVELRYMLRVGAGVVQGDYTNTVTPLIGGVPVGNTAQATVTVTADPDFEQTTIVGTVFGDADGDGWQDEGEAGIPGVRLATVEGLIIETDAFGRYHIAGVDGGRRDRGRNFIIKVDPSSLPDGVTFTTENPRVQRITEGLMNRFDFGVGLPGGVDRCCDQIDVKIGEIFFESGSSKVRPEFLPLVEQLADRLRDSRGGTLYIEGHAEPAEALAYQADSYTVMQYFAPRSTKLRPEDIAELDAIIAKWRGAQNVSVSAVGHTCNTPIAKKNRKEFKDNYELSRKRAQAVASYLRIGLGIAPEQVAIDGKGPDQPVASNATPEGGALNRRVELTISGQARQQVSTPATLARDRANAVYEALRKLLGDDMVRNIRIETGALPPGEQELDMDADAQTGWLSRGAGALLGLVIGTAQADGLPEACTVDSCRTAEGYVIQIVPSSDAPMAGDTLAARADTRRVDVSGRFSVPVGNSGMLWATEDPSGATPRLALHGPELAPVEGGALAPGVSFFVYSNYAAFIDRAEVQVYHGDDIDLIEPLAIVPFKPGVFSRIDWPGTGVERRLEPGDELYYRVRAWDDAGHYDETHLEHLRLVSVDEFDRSAESDADLLLPVMAGSSDGIAGSRLGPLDGNVLVLQPPAEDLERERGTYTVTPHFDTRKTVLKPADRAELDRIVSEWAGAENVHLHVIGHTDNVRIAPENRKEFANNQVLSEARARAVAAYVGSRLALPPSAIVTEGRAQREPVASNTTAAGRAQNRRVELTITGTRVTRTITKAAGKKLVEPASNTVINITESLEEAVNLISARLGDSSTSTAGRHYADVAVAQSSAHALEAVYGRSDLRLQRIPVNGSRVRIHGQDIGGNTALRIDGQPVPLDTSGRYAVEYLVPVGRHDFDVELVDADGRVTDRQKVPVEVSGRHIFLVALADLTLSDSSISGSIEPLAADDRYDDDFLVEGRIAFYLKGKIKGKYLITAQMDSQEEEIGDLFSNLFDKDPRNVLRRLDPDRYYPVYGDDSTTYSDTDTQGRFYFRADWDRSSATWGNFHTGFTGTEFAQYNRSLYGAHLRHESLRVTSKGEAKTEALAFVSEAQTAFGHSEFIGTGGSLYYLKHQDILPGSEKAWIEVRDRDSDRVRDLITLQRGIDYEVDELQGRIILSRPLMQISRLQSPGLIKDTPLDGDDLVLLVDYEYLPAGFGPDKVTVGGRGKMWLTDDIAVGATLVSENRDTEDYNLLGGDILWQPGEGTYVKAEFAQSEASQADRFQSADGGLTFDDTTPLGSGREGDAWGVEARVNSREAMNTDNEWVGGAWYRRTDDNFSVARRDPGVDTTEYGVELTGHLSDRMDLSARGSVVERETIDEDRRLSLQVDYALSDRSELSGELRSVEETRVTGSADGTLMALRYSYDLSDSIAIYGIGQFTLSNDSGRYDNNDLATVGISMDLNGKTTLHGEYSTGHRGDGALLSLDYRLDDRHEVYGTFTQSADRTDLREPGTRIALGHRSRITDQATLFNERQFVEEREQAGIAHVFGLDFELSPGWAIGLSVQSGELETSQGNVDRDAGTVSASYRGERVNWRGKAEYRNENGFSDVRQVLTTNRLDLKLSEDWRLLTRVNHSETEDQTLTDRDDSAVFTEAGVGFAYRPLDGRLNMLAKYTFLYDLPAPAQIDGGTDQRSHVVSLEGIYRINPKWEIGGKVAQRQGELRIDRDFGQWFESSTDFFALRGRYHLVRRWDAMIEYRMLDTDDAGSSRDGWLLSVDRHINDHFRIGVGYNFTDFSDDLTDLDYDHKGWFINALGKY